jgi:AcrR family transcriptional regulator
MKGKDMRNKTTKTDDILFAAAKIVQEKGVAAMTLEAIAKEAKVSKGGLLYHFPNKDAIVQGLIEKCIENYSQMMIEILGKNPTKAGSWSKAYIDASINEPKEMKLIWMAGILLALAYDRAFLDPLNECFRQWQKRAESDGIDPVDATAIKLVADGIWFLDLFGFTHISKNMKKNVKENILNKVNIQ